ncbi:MAG: xanthine dehydrogenase family protein subunit M [Acidobacteriaceae bacterium]|nr:xanthine dehydrogenase family protein subunit M [Acidobacteriaceae bacterium]
MIPASFEYLRPGSLNEAIAMLSEHGDEAKILSGGQSLIPMMKFRLSRPACLIDINRIPNLDYIKEEDGYLKIGGLTRETALEHSDLIRSRFPILHDTSFVIADVQVRNLATVGGNLAHGDPANDHPATMLALDAEIVATGPQGERIIPVKDFFVAIFTTALRPEEILTEIRIPMNGSRRGGAYLKVERKVGDYATAGVAVQVTLNDRGDVQRAGIGLTNVGPTPIKATGAEGALAGKQLTDEGIAEAARRASEEAQPSSDLRGPAEYKTALVQELTRRALYRAWERAKK